MTFRRQAQAAGLMTPRSPVVLEKPLGRDLQSAQAVRLEPCPAGTPGPAAAHELLARSVRAWHEENL